MTSALKNGPRAATSAEPAETSGEARPATEAAGRAKEQRVRVTSAPEDGPVTSGDKQGAREQGEPDTRCARGTSEREGIRGRPIEAGRTYAEVAFSGIKGGEALRILQSKRFEHPFRGNCTAWHRARTPRDKRSTPRLASLCRPEKDTHRVKKGVFETLTQGTGGVY